MSFFQDPMRNRLGMSAYLPPNLLALFHPGPPLKYLPPSEEESFERYILCFRLPRSFFIAHTYRMYRQPMGGVSAAVQNFEDPKDAPPFIPPETKEERIIRKVYIVVCANIF